MSEGCGDDGKGKCAADPSTTEAEEDLGKIAMLEHEANDSKCAAGDTNYCSGYYPPTHTNEEYMEIGGYIALVGSALLFTPAAPLGGFLVFTGLVVASRGFFPKYIFPMFEGTSSPTATSTPTATATATPQPLPFTLVTVGPDATATPTPFQPSPNPISIFH